MSPTDHDEPVDPDMGPPTDQAGATDDVEPSRPGRSRRRRNRRPPSAERVGEGNEVETEPTDTVSDDESSVVDVEPDLANAQAVEHVVAPGQGVARGDEPAVGQPPEASANETALPPAVAPPSSTRAPEAPRESTGRGRQGGYGPAPRGQQQAGRPGQQRGVRPSGLPAGVPSAAMLDEPEPPRPAAQPRQEPQGDLALLLRGFEEIQQRHTDRLLSALRQTVVGDGAAATRTLTVAERVGVFVDVPNLVYAARYLNRWIDFSRLLDRLLGGRRLIRAHAYSPTDPDPSAEQQFLTPVKSQGFRLTTKNYRTFASGAKKADMDLDLCMDVVRLTVAKAIDCVVLCSGDGDFLPMLEFCSDHGVRVEVASFIEATSDELRQACDRFYNLSAMEGIRLSRPLASGS